MQKVLSLVLGGLMALLGATVAHGATAEFSWLPNQDDVTQGYEIYCDRESLAGGGSHELWKQAPMDNIEADGRVHFVWEDFPERETFYCVCVAKGVSEGQMMTSDFSNELEVLMVPEPVQPGVPKIFMFEGTFSGTITPVN